MSTLIGANVEFELTFEGHKVEFVFDINSSDILKSFIVKCSEEKLSKKLNEFFESILNKNIFKSDLSKDSDGQFLLLVTQAIENVFFIHNPSFKTMQADQGQDAMICRCFGISEEQIRSAIKNGALDLLSITNITKASGGCGSCRVDIENLISASKHDIVVNENHFDSTFYAALSSKFAKYPRELINNKTPFKFLKEDIFPLSKKDGFEVLGLVEKNLYIKSQSKQIGLEQFLASKELDISIYYS